MQSQPLTDHFVVEVTGLTARDLLDPSTVASLQRGLIEHQVLVLRDLRLTPLELVEFGRHWGELRTETPHPSLPEFNAVTPISNSVEWGHLGVGTRWHSDGMYLPRRSRYSMLYAHQPAASGGETLFCDTYRAYDALPPEIKALIADRVAFHVTKMSAPMVLLHPDTHRKALYVNLESTFGVRGLPLPESMSLLELLNAHISREEFVYRHRYRTGDLVMCDGFATLHRLAPSETQGLRILYRVATVGDGPPAA